MKDNFVYRYGDNLYINLTNRCSNSCDFCIRNNGDGIGDSGNLWLEREPSAEEVIARVSAFDDYNEIVFCGYGEPTYKVDEIVEIARFAHSQNKKTRLNTNGHGNFIHGVDIVPLLAGVIDIVSVSLNASSAKAYDDICHSVFGEEGFSAMLDFTHKCVTAGIETVMSVVATNGVDIDACREIALKTGAKLKVREYIG